jgi:hypothetical protein
MKPQFFLSEFLAFLMLINLITGPTQREMIFFLTDLSLNLLRNSNSQARFK